MTDDRYIDEDTVLVFVAQDGRVLDRFEPGSSYRVKANYLDAFRLLAAIERDDPAAKDRILRGAEAVPLLNGIIGIALTLGRQLLGERTASVFDDMAGREYDAEPVREFRALGEQDQPV